MNKSDVALVGLRVLGLNTQEATIYTELLKKPATHAQVSLATGINRTTIYRLIGALEKRGLVVRRTDDMGKFLIAADPSTLEADVITREEQAKRQRAVLDQLVPKLEGIQKGYEADFAINTYDGTGGFKHMLWHELKTQGDCLCICFGTMEDVVLDRRWAEKHRQKTVEAGYNVREISNPGSYEQNFTENQHFLDQIFEGRTIPHETLPIHHLITVYNNTVAIYHIHEGKRVGLEIISKVYAETMRKNFEILWGMAS